VLIFCNRKRIIKPFEFVMLTETDVQYKPFHNQLSKPEFVELIKELISGVFQASCRLKFKFMPP